VPAIAFLKWKSEHYVIAPGNEPRSRRFVLDGELLHIRRKAGQTSLGVTKAK
jgi:hypothetical protein